MDGRIHGVYKTAGQKSETSSFYEYPRLDSKELIRTFLTKPDLYRNDEMGMNQLPHQSYQSKFVSKLPVQP